VATTCGVKRLELLLCVLSIKPLKVSPPGPKEILIQAALRRLAETINGHSDQ